MSRRYYKELREKYLNLAEIKEIKKEMKRLGTSPLLESENLLNKPSQELNALKKGFEGISARVSKSLITVVNSDFFS